MNDTAGAAHTDRLAQRLTAARRDSAPFDFDSRLEPKSVAEAFAVSAAVGKALGGQVGGWKVGFSPDRVPIAAPMYLAGFRRSGGVWQLRPGLPMLPEVEIALKLGRDLPADPARPYSREEILDAAEAAMVVFELVESRYRPGPPVPFLAGLADDIAHAGFVIGESIKDIRHLDLASLRCRLWIDGALVSDRQGGHPFGEPLAPLMAWASAQSHPMGSLRAGEIVTTGNLTPGLSRLTAGARLEAEIDGIGRVAIDVKA